VTALEIERPNGQTQMVIVRQHGDLDLRRSPNIAADEYRLLQILQSLGLAAPKPYYLSRSDNAFCRLYVVLEYVDGESDFAPTNMAVSMLQLATQFATIHSVGATQPDLSFLPRQEELESARLRGRPTQLDESLDEGRIRDILEPVWPVPQLNPSTLLHGDFWPGNVLWNEGHIVAVIDWEDAALGDPLADLANSRLEMLWAFGIDAMNDFTRQYVLRMPAIDVTQLPYWDLCAALRPASKISEWGLDTGTERAMRAGHASFVSQAVEKLRG
jgi:aminoglycoside phosphotransferase (APT) family kinase protein